MSKLSCVCKLNFVSQDRLSKTAPEFGKFAKVFKNFDIERQTYFYDLLSASSLDFFSVTNKSEKNIHKILNDIFISRSKIRSKKQLFKYNKNYNNGSGTIQLQKR